MRRHALLKFSKVMLIFIFALQEMSYASQLWQNRTNGIREKHLLSIAADTKDENIIYIGSDRAIYKTIDGGLYWQWVLGVRGSKKQVNFLLIAPEYKNTV